VRTGVGVVLWAVAAVGLGGCSGEPPSADAGGVRAVLVGELVPGAAAAVASPPRVTLVFSGPGGGVRRVQVVGGRYEVSLPAGTYSVRATDGMACAEGVVVGVEGRQRFDLTYPSGDCKDAG